MRYLVYQDVLNEQIRQNVAYSYCYGGKFAVDFNTKGLTDASVGCHPSFVKPDSFVGLKAPLMLNCSEEDELFPVKLLEEARIKVAADGNASEHDFKVFPGCVAPDLTRRESRNY